jgi:hypothetical protein
LEDQLVQRRLTGRAQDGTRWPAQLVSKLTYLANGLASQDAPPTAAEREVHALLKQRLAGARARLDEVLDKDVATFNALLKERGIEGLLKKAHAPAEPD